MSDDRKAEVTYQDGIYTLRFSDDETLDGPQVSSLVEFAFAAGATEVRHSYDMLARIDRILKGEKP